jgi:hypothetical protein
MADTVRSSSGQEFTAAELAQLIKEQHAEIKRQDVLLVVKDQQITQLQADLLAARSPMDPYQVACEIASKAAPSNDDMRRLRAAEVAIAYCGRPKTTANVSVNEHRMNYDNIRSLEEARKRAAKVIPHHPDNGAGAA